MNALPNLINGIAGVFTTKEQVEQVSFVERNFLKLHPSQHLHLGNNVFNWKATTINCFALYITLDIINVSQLTLYLGFSAGEVYRRGRFAGGIPARSHHCCGSSQSQHRMGGTLPRSFVQILRRRKRGSQGDWSPRRRCAFVCPPRPIVLNCLLRYL